MSQSRRRTAKAYVDARVYSPEGWGGVRVTVRAGPDQAVARFLQPEGQSLEAARLLGVEEALTLAKELGAARVVVFCDDEATVRLLARGEKADEAPVGPYLRVRALMKQFRGVAAVRASALPPEDCRSLLKGFGEARVRPLGRPRNLSLFPRLAA